MEAGHSPHGVDEVLDRTQWTCIAYMCKDVSDVRSHIAIVSADVQSEGVVAVREAIFVCVPKHGALRGLLLGKVPPCLTCEDRKALTHCERLQTASSSLPQLVYPSSDTHGVD